jgi:copper chaperone
MYQFKVPDMTCGHCVSTIPKAVKSDDPAAKIEISLTEHLVKVESRLSQDELKQRIAEAGYTPSPV